MVARATSFWRGLVLAFFLFSPLPLEAASKPLRAIELQGVVETWVYRDVQLSLMVPGNDRMEDLKKLAGLVEANGYRVYIVTDEVLKAFFPDEWLFGLTDHDAKVIYLNIGQTVNSALATLLHEFGHVLQPEKLKGDAGQIWAEGFAQLVAQKIGLDSLNASIAYMRTMPKFLWVLQFYSRELDALATKVAGGLK